MKGFLKLRKSFRNLINYFLNVIFKNFKRYTYFRKYLEIDKR